MKTLDEVINALEICGHDESPKCPYFDTEHWCCCEDHMRSISPLKDDALHYLKEYQWQMTNPDGDHQQLLKCQALLQDFYRNEPLTWDELCSRNGMPVWIEDSFDNGEWYIIECFTASNRFVAHDRWGDTTLFNKKEMDDVWKAYRREHHEN